MHCLSNLLRLAIIEKDLKIINECRRTAEIYLFRNIISLLTYKTIKKCLDDLESIKPGEEI